MFPYFSNYTIDKFSELHNNTFQNSSTSTKSTFSQSLKRLEKVYEKPFNDLNLVFLKDPVELWERLEESKYSFNTSITTFTSVLKLLKMVDAPLNLYNKYLLLLKMKTRIRDQDSIISHESKLEYIPNWQDLKNILIQQIDQIDSETSFYDMKLMVFLGLLILNIPLRISSFSKMKIVYEFPSETNANYLYIDTQSDEYKLIINNLKSDTRILIISNEKLKNLLNNWLENYNGSNNLLISHQKSTKPLDQKHLRSLLSSASNFVFDIELNDDDILSSYMKNLMELDPSLRMKIEISSLMGYNTLSKLESHGNQ